MLDRRQFLAGSAASIAALTAPGALGRRAPIRQSPNDEIRVAVIGLRGRGRNHVDGFRRLPGVRVAALCDCDENVLRREAGKFADRGEEVATFVDLRRVLEQAEIDAVSVATPNHWHALASIWACQAGKDVYVEKPVSHNVWEGRQLVRAAREHGRIVQAGVQSRSSPGIAEALAWLHDGGLGRILWAQGLCYKPRKSIGKVEGLQEPPAGLDYGLWTGPAPLRPLTRKNLHYDWHWVYDTGNGDLGNQGIHQVDLCRRALGEQGLAPAVLSVGGRVGYDDDGETPNSQIVLLAYGAAPLVFEVRGLPRDRAAQRDQWDAQGMDRVLGSSIGVLVHCEEGVLRIPNNDSAIALDGKGKEIRRWKGSEDHYANFIAAVRSRRRQDLTADIEEGHVSSALCHLGLISHRLGEAADPDALKERLASSERGRDALERLLAHLERNRVDLKHTPLSLGAALELDPTTERFTNSPEGDRLLRREDRAPFVVPATV